MKFLLYDDCLVYFDKVTGFQTVRREDPSFCSTLDDLLAGRMKEQKATKASAKSKHKALKPVDISSKSLKSLTNGDMVVVNKGNDNYIQAFGSNTYLPRAAENIFRIIARQGYAWKEHREFWRRCTFNPDRDSIKQFFRFAETNRLTVCNDGTFVAYKGVTSHYYDYHTHTFDNHPGNTVEMNRADCTMDPHRACSSGLHVATLEYATSFASGGGHVVIVKVDPADVVSVPFDSSSQKIRVCKYKVFGDYKSNNSIESSVVDDKQLLESATYVPSVANIPINVRSGAWTEQEKNLVKDLCKDGKSSSYVKAANLLSRTVSDIKKFLKGGVKVSKVFVKPSYIQLPWSDKDVSTLKKYLSRKHHYPTIKDWRSIETLIKNRHSADACRKKARALGLY